MVTEVQERNKFSKPLEYILTCKDIEREDEELVELSAWRDNKLSNNKGCEHLETLLRQNSELKINHPSIINPQELELNPLLKNLKYVFLAQPNAFPIIIFTSLTSLHEEKLLRVLRDHKLFIGWTIVNFRGNSPNVCILKIFLKEGYKTTLGQQRCLNPIMEVVKKEILKWLDAKIIYPIAYSLWVSPM